MSTEAIMGTFVKIGTMADGTPRLVLDLQCTLSEVAAMGLIPGVPFAIARLTQEAAGKPVVPQQQEPKEKPGQLCVMAVNFCKDPMFRKWLPLAHGGVCANEDDAKQIILTTCGVSSRRELDADDVAADCFHRYFRQPFIVWRDAQ